MRNLTILLILALASTAFAVDGFFVKTSTAPTIDGAIDAAWIATNPIVYSNFIEAWGEPLTGPGDLDIQFRAMWDDTNLYVLVEITADNFLNQDTPVDGWFDDSIEIYIDVNDLNTYPYTNGGAGGIFQTVEVILLGEVNPFTPSNTAGPVTGMDMKMVLTGSAGTAGSYTLEALLPWAGLGGGYTPAPANEIGFGIGFNDADQIGQARNSQLQWVVDEFDLWTNASHFPTVQLLAELVVNPGDVNLDGIVDNKDATIILTNWDPIGGAYEHTDGDLNDDGKIDRDDLLIVRRPNWGSGLVAEPPEAPEGAGVPEPSTLLLLAGGVLAGLIRRR